MGHSLSAYLSGSETAVNTGIWHSRFLVLGQMILIVLILSPMHQLWAGSLATVLASTFMMLSALALALWALTSMRLKNFSVMPEPVDSAALITHGPYQHLRHPMYSAVLLGTLGACIAHQSAVKWVFLVILFVVLLLKIRREEQLLATRFADYEQYKSHTNAIIPRLL